MKNPILFILSHEADEQQQIERDLHTRYADKYRLLLAASGEEALRELALRRDDNDSVALLLVHQARPGMSGTQFLAQAASYCPEARKVLLAAAKDTEAAIAGINQLGIHYYLVLPWRPEKIMPVLDELLDDWRTAVQLPYLHVTGIMETRVARIRAEQVTYDEQRGLARPSLYRTQLLLQTHERFLRDYVSKSTGPALDHLWAITSGLCSEHHDYRWMRQQVDHLEADAAARKTRGLGPETLARLSAVATPGQPPASDVLAWFERVTDVLAEEDRRFLNAMKLALRRGVQVFESFERHTLAQGRQPLLEAAQRLPRVLAEYYERVTRQVETI